MNVRPINYTTRTRKLADEIDQFNMGAKQHTEARQRLSEAAFSDSDDLQLTRQNLDDERENRVDADLMLRQEAVRLLQWRSELARQIATDASATVDKADKAHETATAKTAKGLKDIGLGPESTVAGWHGGNPAAAEHQFQHVVKRAVPVRMAEKALVTSRHVLEAAQSDVTKTDAEATTSRDELREFVSQQVA